MNNHLEEVGKRAEEFGYALGSLFSALVELPKEDRVVAVRDVVEVLREYLGKFEKYLEGEDTIGN